MANPAPKNIPLPPLREELQLLPGAKSDHGEATWMIFDPIKNAYFHLSARAFVLLKNWLSGPSSTTTDSLLQNSNKTMGDKAPFDARDIQDLLKFVYENRLTTVPPGADVSGLAEQANAASPPLWKQAIHKYLFIKIPLVSPEPFLRAAYPFIKPVFTLSLIHI